MVKVFKQSVYLPRVPWPRQASSSILAFVLSVPCPWDTLLLLNHHSNLTSKISFFTKYLHSKTKSPIFQHLPDPRSSVRPHSIHLGQSFPLDRKHHGEGRKDTSHFWSSFTWSGPYPVAGTQWARFWTRTHDWDNKLRALTLPFSTRFVIMTMIPVFCSQIILQKSSNVDFRGPWVAM